ncbi:MAG TPA: isoprenyl transferase [Nitrospinota bacterium]|nr:isoprenyl transferase [Nitrospinota bacterium]
MLDQKLLVQINRDKLPKHIAIIMDGNGRWARKRSLPRIEGHKAGVKAVEDTVISCRELGINALTLYSFSLENWKRPQSEIDSLMDLLKEYIVKELPRMIKEKIRFNVIGKITDLPTTVQEFIDNAVQITKKNNGLILTLALSYGARDEIVTAVQKIITEVRDGTINHSKINDKIFESYLYTNGLPELDLLIRTSGEIRLSNFLLWQSAYTELYFTKILWPDFRGDDLLKAIIEYQKRERRFGFTEDQLNFKREK